MLTNEDQKINKTFGGWLVCWCQRGSVPKGQAQWVSSFAPMKLPPGVEIRNDKRWSDCLWPAHVIRNGGGQDTSPTKDSARFWALFLALLLSKCNSIGPFWCNKIISSSSTSACAHLNFCACGHIHAFSISIYIYIYIYIYMYAHIQYASPQFYILQCLV